MGELPIHPKEHIEVLLSALSHQPGIYRMYTAAGELIYIGKAKSLKNRVRSYFRSFNQHTPKVARMVSEIVTFDTIVTDTELEALILEYTLIKKHRPRYNIIFRDGKRFPWIGISNETYPRLFVTREPKKVARTKFFGPYVSSSDMYIFLKLIRKHFPLRQRRKPLFKDRPCINYFIGLCPGPCQNKVSVEDYAKTIAQIELLLKGQTEELLNRIEAEMVAASEALEFEQAGKLRDRYKAVQSVCQKQKIVSSDPTVSQDVIAMASNERRIIIVILSIRQGKLIRNQVRDFVLNGESSPEELYQAFVPMYYQDMDGSEDFPEELILQMSLLEEELLESWLTAKRGKKVSWILPQRGHKKELLEMGIKNAKEVMEKATLLDASKVAMDPTQALIDLQDALNLPDFPRRMECYDISHVQGTNTVASMVVFTDGVPDKAAYRKFKIKIAEGKPDDFASMAEVIQRRFAHDPNDPKWMEPDLVIIDGGKGQLSAAIAALNAQGILNQPIISLAKRYEEVYLPGGSVPVILPRDSTALFLLQQIRDEAHRFAITFHRSLRAKSAIKSTLDTIPGIGKQRKEKLLKAFGSFQKIQNATPQEIQSVLKVSPELAYSILKTINSVN